MPNLFYILNINSPLIPKKQFGGLMGGGMAGGIGKAADAVNGIVNAFGKDTTQGPNGDLRAGIDQGWNAISDAAANFGPYGQVVSAGMKAVNMLNGIQGAIFGATDNMTKVDSIMDSPLGFLTGVGWINQAFGKTSDTITRDEETFEQVGSSYGGTSNTVDDAVSKSGKKYGAFSGKAREEANAEIAEAKRQQTLMADIATNAQNRNAIKASMSAINGNKRQFQMQGGYNQAAIHAGRQGMILERAKQIVNDYNQEDNQDLECIKVSDWEYKEAPIESFQKGGAFNIIPEGALHARKHEIDLDNITHKGIPVISESEGGEIQQHAEIERDEIILRLEVTKKLEELLKEYEDSEQKDEIAIEAGKLLVEEILHNTQDNTNLIEETNG